MDTPSSIRDLPSRATELSALLETWARLNSGSENAGGLARMSEAVHRAFSTAFPLAQSARIPVPGGRGEIVSVRMRPAAPHQILLNGHFDTVYEPDHPFQECRWLDPEHLNGPGVADMKGGIVVLFAALRAFEATPHASNVGWEVLLSPDEETGSERSRPFLEEAARRHDLGLVFEPARGNGDLVRSRKGIGTFTLTCHGRAAHAGRVPNDGRNAIVALAGYLVSIARIPEELPGVLLNVGNIRGGGAVNVVPDLAVAEINVRVTTAREQQAVVSRLDELADPIRRSEGFRLLIDGGFNRPPKECLPVEETLFAAWQQAARDLGQSPFGWVHAGGASDGNILTAAGLPNLDGVGVVGDHLHSDREYCEASTLVTRAQLCALVLHRLARGEIDLPRRASVQG